MRAMAGNAKEWFVRTEDGRVYGPADIASLVAWAKDGRIEPSGFVSRDRLSWVPAQLMPELEMKWLVETEPGKVFGPFNRALVVSLFSRGALPADAKAYRLHEMAVDRDPPPVVKEVRVEVPVEKVVEKIVEVPVEKIVERVIEVVPPARTGIVVSDAPDPVANVPPARSPGSIFGNMDRSRLAALEAAAQRELAKGRRFGLGAGIFGRKR